MNGNLFVEEAIAVLTVRPVWNAGNLRGLASIRLGPLTIHDCRIIQQPGQRAWVSLWIGVEKWVLRSFVCTSHG